VPLKLLELRYVPQAISAGRLRYKGSRRYRAERQALLFV